MNIRFLRKRFGAERRRGAIEQKALDGRGLGDVSRAAFVSGAFSAQRAAAGPARRCRTLRPESRSGLQEAGIEDDRRSDVLYTL
jgi:hypothetical protein